MLKARYFKHTLNFKRPSGTSRGVLNTKESWFILVWNIDAPEVVGIGECGLLKGLSLDDVDNYEEKLKEVCNRVNEHETMLTGELNSFPSIQFGLEMALLDLNTKGSKQFIRSPFITSNTPISINGLIWMGEKEFMLEQIKSKLETGFRCVKLKIGAIDFEQELDLLKFIRNQFTEDDLELRVDANGAFTPENAIEKLKRLSELDLHSIEQPIKQGQIEEMAKLCDNPPFPIALDEELIAVTEKEAKHELLNQILPQYIILKPSLIGGIKGTNEWIEAAGELSIPWWITSALESNIGLNAIAQYTSSLGNPLPQGLGTGQLYTNNIDSPLEVIGDQLYYNPELDWDLSMFQS